MGSVSDHSACFALIYPDGRIECLGYHCPYCGQPCSDQGHAHTSIGVGRVKRYTIPEVLRAIGVESVKETRKARSMNLGSKAKAVVAFAGSLLIVLNVALHEFAQFLPASWSVVVSGVVAVLTAVGTYQVPNAPAVAPPHQP